MDDDRQGLGYDSGSSPDFEYRGDNKLQDYSGVQDFSEPHDHSNDYTRQDILRGAEHGATAPASKPADPRSQRDIAYDNLLGDLERMKDPASAYRKQAANRMAYQMERLDNIRGNAQEKAKTGTFWSQQKNKLIGAGAGLLLAGGVFTGGMLIAGPAQILQMGNFLSDVRMFIADGQSAIRYAKQMGNMYRAFKTGNADRIQRSRLGIFSRQLANRLEKNMAARGITIGSNFFGNGTGMDINLDVLTGSSSSGIKLHTQAEIDAMPNSYGKYAAQQDFDNYKAKATSALDDLGIKDGSGVYTVVDGKPVVHFDIQDMKKGTFQKLLYKVNHIRAFNIVGKISTRLMLVKIGKISVLHPIQSAKKQFLDDLAEFIERAINNIENGTLELPTDAPNREEAGNKAAQSETDKLNKRNEGLPDNAKLSPDEIADAANDARKGAENTFDEALKSKENSILQRGILKMTEKLGGTAMKQVLENIMKGAAKGGLVGLVVMALCMLQDAVENGGPYKMQSVITGIAEVMQFLGYMSQMQAGDDGWDYQIAGNVVNTFLGDDLPVQEVQDDGSIVNTGKTEFNSAWDALPIKCELNEASAADCAAGANGTDQSLQYMPAGLTDVSKTGFAFFSKTVNDVLNGVLGSGSLELTAMCWVNDKLNDAIGWVIDKLTFGLMDKLMGWFMGSAAGQFLATLFQSFQGVLYGKLLSPEVLQTATPTGHGFVMAYSAGWSDSMQSNLHGGRQMSSTEAQVLYNDQRQYLAWQQSQKPLLARLFDPTDYNSTLNQIARAANFDTSSQSVSTQFANIFRFFGAVPSLFASAINKIGGVAFADPYSTAPYDYGTGTTYAFSSAEMDKISGGNSSFEYEANTNYVLDKLDAGDPSGWTGDSGIAAKCFGMNMDKDGALTQVDNSDGSKWNFADMTDSNHAGCASSSDDMLHLRVYLMDWANVTSGLCYEDGLTTSPSSDGTAACAAMGMN